MAQMNIIGKNILGYTVSEKIDSGAFGTVYKVVKSNAAGQYIRALKHITIPTEKQYNSVLNSMGGDVSKAESYFSQMLDNIVSEIKVLNFLSEKDSHHVVRYYENDIITTSEPKRYDIFILMEYLTPVEEYIKRRGFLVQDVCKLGLDILSGLKLCHDSGVIHRDVKDDNIFVSDNGDYKIGDFGVSKVLKDSSKAESLKGTPNFLAPEVYLGKAGYTKSVDLYSLGIVLYRLLNYSRNPFLPSFPEQYYAQDEDNAFEARMRGEIPDLPSLGGDEIGHVVVKSISGSRDRYQTADEFIEALRSAIEKTQVDVLKESIGLETNLSAHSSNEPNQKQYASTLGAEPPKVESDGNDTDEQSSSINKHLFDSIGQAVSEPVPDVNAVMTDERGKCENTTTVPDHTVDEKVTGLVQYDNIKPEDPPAIDKKTIKKFVFVFPVVVLLIGVVAFFIVVPSIYGKVVSFFDWIFSDPQNIIDALRDSNVILSKAYSIVGIRVFWWIWIASFAASLFAVGKQLHNVKEKDAVSVNAVLKNKEPYLMTQNVYELLRQIKTLSNSRKLDSLLHAVNRLKEKLYVESDFGYGNDAVIACENSIAGQLGFLTDAVGKLENDDCEERINAMNKAVMNINSLLQRRIELKRR